MQMDRERVARIVRAALAEDIGEDIRKLDKASISILNLNKMKVMEFTV